MFDEIFEVGGLGGCDYSTFETIEDGPVNDSVEIVIRQSGVEKILHLDEFELCETVGEESAPHVTVTMHGVYRCTTS